LRVCVRENARVCMCALHLELNVYLGG